MRALFILAGLVVAARAGAQVRRPFTEADLDRLYSAGDARLSPDGSRLAFVRGSVSVADNSSKCEVVVLATATGAELMSWPGSAPRWSPDGRSIAYAGSRAGQSGIWIHELGRGADRFLAPTPQSDAWLGRGSSKNFDWSPDGKWIAYVAAEPAGPPPSGDVKVFSRVMYKTRTGFTDDRRTHLWLVAAGGGEPRALTSGRFDEHSVSWAPDSKRVAFVSDRSADPDNNFANDIFVLDIQTGATTQLTNTRSAEFLPVWSPDGQWIAFEAWVRTNNTKDSPAEDTKAYVIPAQGGSPRRLAPALDRRLTEITWHPSGKAVYFSGGDRGANVIYRAGLADSAAEVVVGGLAQSRGISFDARGETLAFIRTETTRPAEVFVIDLATRRERQITRLHDEWRSQVALQDAETFWFTSFDGTRIQGWIMKPAGLTPGRRYPAILNIHGGPHSGFGFAFFDRHQLWAAAGFGVVYLNPRGSAGYGQSVSDGSLLNWGGGDYQDLMIGLDSALARNPWIDTTRLGVTGGSYGGFMTNWIITQTHRFKTAISLLSLSNLVSFYGTSLYTDLIEAEFRGLPWDNYGMLWQWSPLAHVAGVTTPTLFIHGEADNEVPITQAEEMYVALRKQGVEATLARYPGEGHGFHEPRHVADLNHRMLEWFSRHLGPPAATP